MELAFDAAWENDTMISDERPTSPVLEPLCQDIVKHESYVGVLPREQEEDLHARRHRALIGMWSALRDATDSIQSWDGSIKAAADVLALRVHEVSQVAGLLVRVSSASQDVSLADEFAPDAPLTAYLAGSYLWLDGVVPSLTILAKQLADMNPDWSSFRQRLDDVAWLFEMTEREQMSVDLSWLPAQLASDVKALFVALDTVKLGVNQPFG